MPMCSPRLPCAAEHQNGLSFQRCEALTPSPSPGPPAAPLVLCAVLRPACLLHPAVKQTDCAYQEVRDVRVVSRGLGAWGDMVIELSNGDKLELRSLEK